MWAQGSRQVCLSRCPKSWNFYSISRFGKIFSSNFPGTFPQSSSRTDPGNSHSLLEFSEKKTRGGKAYRGNLSPSPRKFMQSTIPSVQTALQTEKNYFRINYAFHSRYRYRRKLFWNCFFRSRCRHSCSLQI